MAEGYEELFKSLIEKEMTAPDESVQDTKRNAIASLIPMAAGVLTGQVSQGAQLGMSTYKTLEDQRSKSRGKLLDYLAKMNAKKTSTDWQMKDTESGVVMFDKNSGQWKETGLHPFQKDIVSNWQQAGGTDYLTFFRKNPKDGTPEIVKTDTKMRERMPSPFLDIAAKRLEEDIKEREEKKVQKYAEDLDPIMPLGQSLETIETFLAKNEGKDLPGVGMLDIAAGKFGLKASLSDPKLSPEEAMFVNAVNELKRGESLKTGGKALTQIEMEMVEKGIGLLNKGGEENFRMGIKYIRDGYNAYIARTKAKYPPEVSKKFSDRGGDLPKSSYNGVSSSKKASRDAEKAAIEAELKKLKGNK